MNTDCENGHASAKGQGRRTIFVFLILLLSFVSVSCTKDIRKGGETLIYPLDSEADSVTMTDFGQTAEAVIPETVSVFGTEAQITVFVCGAVIMEGVYALPEGSRLYDAVNAAGGFSQDADTSFLNLAAFVSDGQKVEVYTKEQTALIPIQPHSETGGVSSSDAVTDGKVNLNTATLEELMTLNGIGKSRAAAIISYREEHGSFQSIEEIMNVSGIKTAAFEKIKDRITVSP